MLFNGVLLVCRSRKESEIEKMSANRSYFYSEVILSGGLKIQSKNGMRLMCLGCSWSEAWLDQSFHTGGSCPFSFIFKFVATPITSTIPNRPSFFRTLRIPLQTSKHLFIRHHPTVVLHCFYLRLSCSRSRILVGPHEEDVARGVVPDQEDERAVAVERDSRDEGPDGHDGHGHSSGFRPLLVHLYKGLVDDCLHGCLAQRPERRKVGFVEGEEVSDSGIHKSLRKGRCF